MHQVTVREMGDRWFTTVSLVNGQDRVRTAWVVRQHPGPGSPTPAADKHPAEREAVALLRAGRTTDALHHWKRHERIVGGDSDDQVIAALANAAAAQVVAGEDVLVVAAARDEAGRAGFAIRTRLLQHGHLDGDHAKHGTLPLAEGDRVSLHTNDRALGARNGTRDNVCAWSFGASGELRRGDSTAAAPRSAPDVPPDVPAR